jgi:hypothetical protein
MQKDIKDGELLFRRCVTLGIGTQAFKDIKLLFTRYALIYTARQYYKALELWFLPYTYKDRAYYKCTSLVRFGLLCKYKLLQVVEDRVPIPYTLLYLRWLLF